VPYTVSMSSQHLLLLFLSVTPLVRGAYCPSGDDYSHMCPRAQRDGIPQGEAGGDVEYCYSQSEEWEPPECGGAFGVHMVEQGQSGAYSSETYTKYTCCPDTCSQVRGGGGGGLERRTA